MSEIKYAYEQLMAEHNLKVSDLPEDAKIGIATIKNIEKAIAMAEKSGKKVSSDTMAKIKANDKWVVNEILDFVDETDENEDDMPYEEEEIVQELSAEELSAQGLAIDKELTEMFNSGKTDWHSDDIKAKYKVTYDCLFENYEDEGENGIETSNFKLIETGDEVFTISKK